MRISSLFALAALLCCPLPQGGEQCRYVKGDAAYFISETASEYVVEEYNDSRTISSRNQNIAERKSRLAALDVIGTYILFCSWAEENGLDNRYFQVFADATALHYNADVVGFHPQSVSKGDKSFRRWVCKKADYNLLSASYRTPEDLLSMLAMSYSRNSNADNAALWFSHDPSLERYFAFENDFLCGNASAPAEVRRSRNLEDAFSQSLFSEDTVATVSLELEKPFLQFAYCELMTSAPLPAKEEYYSKWAESLGDSLWEDVLSFCAKNCRTPLPEGPTVCETILAFPGGLNPYLMRRSSYEPLYDKGAQAYSESDFQGAIQALSESIDIDGLSTRALNLLAGSYRLSGQPEKALAFALLCAKIEPSTQYLCGNLTLCLDALGYSRIEELCSQLKAFAKDEWSLKQIEKVNE